MEQKRRGIVAWRSPGTAGPNRRPQHGGRGTGQIVRDERYTALRALLAQTRRTLEEQVAPLRAAIRERVEAVTDAEEESVTTGRQDTAASQLQLIVNQLEHLNQAETDLERGRYGECHDCGGEIAQPRLAALPFAVTCFDCQERAESAQAAAQEKAHQRPFAGRKE